MSFVITQACLSERYAQCVSVCPVDCIYPGVHDEKPFMVIDPELCISCNACLPVCPISAIVATEEEDPEAADLNKTLAPQFSGNAAVTPRAESELPHRSDNQLRS